jgi:predicted nucleotidyltransferase
MAAEAGMIPLVRQNLSAVERLCTQHGVRRLELFGSATQDRFDAAWSDLDFLVEFNVLQPAAHADAFFGLLFALEDLFGRRVDLVESTAIHNPYFRRAIEPTRLVLYAA